MKKLEWLLFGFFLLCISLETIAASTTLVNSQQGFDDAHDSAAENDTIIWENGTYHDIDMEITKDHLFITAQTLGSVIFKGSSKVEIRGDYITMQGFQFLDGNVGTSDVISIRGSHILFTQNNIRAYRSYKYLRVRESSQYVDITYCNFENRLNLDDQNILSLLVHESNPGYHKIQFCSFKNFDGTGNDLGIEPIRIGLSTQAERNSRSLVEYCYFTQCNGDGELISSKASQNVYRFNTFENNPKAELVLRHGSEAIVYGNFFLNGKGGVRVREGQNHYIYNNYFYEIDDRAIYLQNEDSDPLANINIAFNSIINCAETILGGDGSDRPTSVTFANNIFSEPKDVIFKEPTGSETWINNITDGALGISAPERGVTESNLGLIENSEGFFGLSEGSPAVNAAGSGYKLLPQFPGMDPVDASILFDLMGQDRPSNIALKDLGCNEYPHNILIKPIATEANTGPSYNTSMEVSTNVNDVARVVDNLIEISPNPVSDQLHINIINRQKMILEIIVFDSVGRQVSLFADQNSISGERRISKNIADLPKGVYTIRALGSVIQENEKFLQTLKFVKN